ncbi:MAG: DUF4386 domain-containing protein [Pseudomonadota bacterium]
MTVRMQGRTAGLFYLGVVLAGIFALAYGPGQLIEVRDPAATLANLQARPGLFHAMIAAGFGMNLFFAPLPFLLARFMSAHGPRAAKLMIALALASIPFTLIAFYNYAGLAGAVSAGSASAETVQEARAGYRFWLHGAIFFWGVWLAPYGWLVFKSGAIPRWLGVMLMLGAVSYMIDLFGSLAIDNFYDLPLTGQITLPASIGEIGSCLWLVVFGARESAPQPAAPASEAA